MDGRSRRKMRELRRIFAGPSRYVRSQILLGRASKTTRAKSDEYCHKSFIENVQAAVIGCKGAPLHSPNLRPRPAWERPGPFVFAPYSPRAWREFRSVSKLANTRSLRSATLAAVSARRRHSLGPSQRRECRDKGEEHRLGPQKTSDASDVRCGREERRVRRQCPAPANDLYRRNDREQGDRDEGGYLGPKESVGLVICPSLRGVDRARETDHENRHREDPVPIVDARNTQNVLALCQNPGKEENQEVVRYGEGQIRRREIKHRRYSV